MLQDLDNTLKSLLEKELASELLAQTPVSFVTPGDSIEEKPTINFFLYDVRENVELRSSVGAIGRQENGMVTRIPPPVFVDCSYFVTVWLSTNEIAQEHRLLGEIMTALLRYPIIPTNFVPEGSAVRDHPIRAAALRPGQLMNLGEFWQACGSKPKATLHYTVTIAVSAREPVEIGQPVIEKVIGIKPGADIPISRLSRNENS